MTVYRYVIYILAGLIAVTLVVTIVSGIRKHMKKKFYKNNVGFIIFMVLVYLGIMIESCLRCEKILNKCQMIYEGSM